MTRSLSSPSTRKKHKKILRRAKGFVKCRSKHYRIAKEAVAHALEHSTIDRRRRRREVRKLWIKRLGIAFNLLRSVIQQGSYKSNR